MNTTAIAILIHFSALVTLAIHVEAAATPAEISAPKKITGRPVPTANIAGKVIPAEEVSAIGIMTAKKSTAL